GFCSARTETGQRAHPHPGFAGRARSDPSRRPADSQCHQRTGGRDARAMSAHLVGAFLEMMSAERGAAANTIAAYRRDLTDYAGFVASKKQTLLTCPRETVMAYLDGLKAEGLSASSSARRLSAVRQFHKFLCADGLRGDDPTRIVASPRTRRPLPKVLSVAEVDRLLSLAEAEAN